MSTIVSCNCGAKLRLPANAGPVSVRCPKCKAILHQAATPTSTPAAAVVANPVITAQSVAADGTSPLCPICQTSIAATDPTHTCSTCSQAHHAECWQEVGGCSTYGCKEAPALEKDSATDQPLTAWGDAKICPVCGEKIKSIALKCRYCGTGFDTVDPLSMHDLHRKDRKVNEQKQVGNTVIILFALSLLIGCAAPILAIVNLVYILPRKKELAAAGPFYLVLGYSAIVLTVLYSILLLVFFLAGGTG